MRSRYLVGAMLGSVIPYAFFFQFLLANGLDIRLFVQQMFSTPIAAFSRNGCNHFSFNLVGVSFALPLFFYFG
jgi:hypothetical protein